MTEQPYTPGEADLRWEYTIKRAHDGASVDTARDEFARGIAQVKRDAWEEGAQHGSRSPGYYPDENPYGPEETP